MLKIGSLFTGYGGLDDAVVALTGGQVVFVSDIDAGAKKYLDHYHPDTPNIGDMTTADWSEWSDVDIIVGGYPCQPFSEAGKKRGRDDARHLWPNVLDALTTIRPKFAFFENVRGHLNLGFGDVLTDLTSNGYEVRWSIVAASSVGAPHRRERLFIYAVRDDSARPVDLSGLPDARQYGKKIPVAGHTVGGELVVDDRVDDGVTFAAPLLPTPKASDSYMGRPRTKGRPVEKSTFLPTIATVLPSNDIDAPALLPTPRANDMTGASDRKGFVALKDVRRVFSDNIEVLLPTPTARDTKGRSSRSGDGGVALPNVADDFDGLDTWSAFNAAGWGKYAPAIARWSLLTRPAPRPVQMNRNGNPQLTAEFSEWVMGLDDGRLTSPELGLSRSQALKMAGNGVVPQAALLAFAGLTSDNDNH